MLLWRGGKKSDCALKKKKREKKKDKHTKPSFNICLVEVVSVWFGGCMGKGILLFSKQICPFLLNIVSQEKS